MHSSTLLVPLALFGLTAAGTTDRPAYAPGEGLVLQRTVTTQMNLELDSISIVFNGEEIPSDNFADLEVTLSDSERLVITDQVVELGEGRPNKLVRSFEELSGEHVESTSTPEGDDEQESARSSELEGSTVVFTWDEDDQEYEVEFEGDGDSDLLEELREDLDLRLFLPAGEVEEGDSWEVDIEAFRYFSSPGGDLGMLREDEDPDEDEEVDEQLTDNLEGTITATYAGRREENGVEVAVIQLEMETGTSAETDSEHEGVESVEEIELSFSLTGELLWNLAGGHASELNLSGDIEFTSSDTSSYEGDGESVEFTQRMTFSGSAEFRLLVELP